MNSILFEVLLIHENLYDFFFRLTIDVVLVVVVVVEIYP
jgi:hypothetical protein